MINREKTREIIFIKPVHKVKSKEINKKSDIVSENENIKHNCLCSVCFIDVISVDLRIMVSNMVYFA